MNDVSIICICGSREFKDKDFVYSKINKFISTLNEEFVIIEGGATGADEIARQYCEENNIVHKTFPADWDTFGKAAGPIRNKYMAEICNYVLAFKLKNKKNKGTNNMISEAKKLGKKVVVYER